MQRKIGTILDEEILKKAKAVASARHTTFSSLLEDALSEYLSRQAGFGAKFSWVEASFGVMRLPRKMLDQIIQEEMHDTD